MRIIPRLVRAPVTLCTLALDAWIWPTWLRLQGVEVGPGLRLVGNPFVRLTPGGRILLRRSVGLYSRSPRYYAPCSLVLSSPGALIEIGEGSQLSATVIMASTSVRLGSHVMVGMNTHIIDSDFHPLDLAQRRAHPTAGAATRPIEVGDDVFVGAGVILLKGTRLGRGCVVGAGAVVSGEYAPGSVIVGNPAKVVKTLSVLPALPS